MLLNSIELKNYKTFKNNTVRFTDNITAIIGANDTGKTNLIEAIANSLKIKKIPDTYICLNLPTIVESTKASLKFNYNLDDFINSNENYEFRENTLDISIRGEKFSLSELIGISKLSYRKVNLSNTAYSYLQENLKVILWEYRKEELKIPEIISLKKSKKNTNIIYILNSLFDKIGIDLTEFLQSDVQRRSNYILMVNDYITEIIRIYWPHQNIEFKFDFTSEDTIQFNIYENRRLINLAQHGDGFKWLFLFILDFSERFGKNIENYIILLDEPGAYLHPGAQRSLLKFLEKLAEDNQIIYTTHSPFMINRMFPERILFFERKDGDIVIKKPKTEEMIDDLMLSNNLGFTLNSLFRWGEVIIFVEGLTDKLFIERLILKYKKIYKKIILDLNLFSIIHTHGLQFLDNFIDLAKVTDSNFIVFIDNDDEAQSKTKKYTQPYPSRAKIHKNTIDHLLFLEKGKTIEDYIPIIILNNALQNISSAETSEYKECLIDFRFEEGIIKLQLRELDKKIKELLASKKIEINMIYTLGKFKFLLFNEIVKLIDAKNIDLFDELIKKIEEINLLYNKLYM